VLARAGRRSALRELDVVKSAAPDLWDTIVAVSTPAGRSLRGIVRLSGPQAVPIVSRLVTLRGGRIEQLPGYGAAEGWLWLQRRRTRVPVALLLMRRPRSYTRDDVVELQSFGAPVLLQMIVEELVQHGARLAEPGEFTRRAFLNGRIDLAQAEAVCALVHARSEAAHRLAIEQLAGTRARALHELRESLIDLCARVEVGIDFSDQDIEVINPGEVLTGVRRAESACEALLGAAGEHAAAVGIPVALFGRPNVGKSSLLNALVGSRRAIVTPVPGTTRDVLEAAIELAGTPFRLIDTAGIRACSEEVEAEAVQRARQALRHVEVALFMLDGSAPIGHDDLAAWQEVSVPQCLVLLNKSDLPAAIDGAAVRAALGERPIVRTSCVTGRGIDTLKETLVELARSGRADASAHGFEPSLRHREALRQAVAALRRAAEVAASTAAAELVAFELRQALDSIGQVTGQTVSEDILDRVFSEFCIGK